MSEIITGDIEKKFMKKMWQNFMNENFCFVYFLQNNQPLSFSQAGKHLVLNGAMSFNTFPAFASNQVGFASAVTN